MAVLNHIGIAVSDKARLEKLFALLGFSVNHSEPVPEQGVVTHFLPLPQNVTNLELLEPSDPQGTIAKFIASRGPGIHHLSFELKQGELDALCGKLKAEGFRLVFEQPRPGAHGMRVNFIHPASAGGVLIEVMEKSPR
jgi:methylmalonyl-CoA/ethylmalonyl-CoA epimerase